MGPTFLIRKCMISEVYQATLAQAPMLNTYAEAAHIRWQSSHGPEIGHIALESAKNIHPIERVLIPGYITLQTFELSSGNETWISNAGADHFAESGGQDVWGSAWEVAQRTIALEVPLTFFAAWALYRMKPAAKAMYEHYIKPADPLNDAEKALLKSVRKPDIEKKPSKLAPVKEVFSRAASAVKESQLVIGLKNSRVAKTAGKGLLNFGLALGTGTGGVEISKDLTDGGETPVARNLIRGAVAATAIVGFNYGVAAGLTGSIKHDIPVLEDVCQFMIDWLKTPVLAASVFTALGLYASQTKRKTLMDRLEAKRIADERATAPIV